MGRGWGGARTRAIRRPASAGGRSSRGVMLRLACPGNAADLAHAGLRHDDLRRDVARSRRATGAINLGQGFPDTDGPREMLEARRRPRSTAGRNQYPPGPGHAGAARGDRRAPAALLRHRRSTRTARCSSRRARPRRSPRRCSRSCEPGDEVVTFEPYYDSYAATIALAGAARARRCLRCARLRGRRGRRCAPRSPPRTRLVLLNTPHNPTGKVFTRAELELVAALAREHDAWVVTDEVYEHLVFDGAEHVPIATLPGMCERTRHDLLGRQDLLGHGLEGRLGAPGRPSWSRRCARVKQFLTYVALRPVPARDRARPRARRRGLCRRCAPTCRPSATCSARGCESAGLQVSRAGRHVLRHRGHRARSASRTASRSAARCPSWPAWSACRCRSSTTTRTRPPAGAVRVLQAGRGAARGGPPARRCRPRLTVALGTPTATLRRLRSPARGPAPWSTRPLR